MHGGGVDEPQSSAPSATERGGVAAKVLVLLVVLAALGVGFGTGVVVGRASLDSPRPEVADPVPETESPTTTVPDATSSLVDPVGDEQVRYLSPTGSDDADGTIDAPWQTLAKGYETLEPGRTLVLREGVYEPGPDIETSGAPDAWIVIRNMDGEKPVIVADSENGIRIDGASYIRISGLEVTASERSSRGAGIRADNGAGHIVISDNHVHDMPGNGIGSNRADLLTIEGNTVHGNAATNANQPSGISLFRLEGEPLAEGFNNVIRGNLVYENENRTRNSAGTFTDGNCIIIDRAQSEGDEDPPHPTYEGSTLIENNICVRNGGRGVHILRSDNVVVRHNTFFRNLQTDVIMERSGELSTVLANNVEFVNNIVVPRHRAQPRNVQDSNNVEFSFNFYGTPHDIDLGEGEIRRGGGDFASDDPRFDPEHYLLPEGSPALDAGTGGLTSVDFFGTTRADPPDLGAIEQP